MKDEKRLFDYFTFGNMVVDTLLFAFGLYLMIKPETSVSVIGIIMGILMLIFGIASIIKFVIKIGKNNIFLIELINGILNIILGLFVIVNPLSLANILIIGLGIWLVISAVCKCAIALQFRKFNEETWIFSLVLSVLTLIIGVLIVVNPIAGMVVIATYIGVMICIYAAMDILQQFLFRKRVNEITKILFK